MNFNHVFCKKILSFIPLHSLHFNNYFFLFIMLVMINFGGCGVYSFTGSSVPEHLQTIAIPIADDRSGSGVPGLRESFTDRLIQKFIDDNTLQVSERVNADAILDCTIVSLTDAPAIVTAGEQVAQRRVTVTVHVIYRDMVKRVTVYEQNFSNYGDYDIDRTLAIDEAIEKITEDILLDTVSGW